MRTYLERNKIFFELFVGTCLSFMAIFISIQSNKISQAQTNIMTQQAIPHLEAKVITEFDSSINEYKDVGLKFYNLGGKIFNFSTVLSTYCWLISDSAPQKIIYEVDVAGYYNESSEIKSAESEDLIYEVKKINYEKLITRIEDSLHHFGYMSGFDTYIKLMYQDIFGKPHVELFRAFGNYVEKLNLKEKDRDRRLRTETIHSFLSFPNVSAIDIINDIQRNGR